MLGQLGDVMIGIVGRILKRDGDDLFVHAALILHRQNADGIALHKAQRTDGLGAKHKNVQRVAVLRPGTGDEAVVRRIVGGGIKDTVKAQRTGFLVHFVLILGALLDLDDREEILRSDAGGSNIMPKVHICFLLSVVLSAIAHYRGSFFVFQ